MEGSAHQEDALHSSRHDWKFTLASNRDTPKLSFAGPRFR